MAETTLDGAELAILINRFEGIARKMTNTLYRTGRSGVLNRARDFSCCIVTHDCQLLATADSLPIHVLVGPDMMARAMKEFHPQLKRGDAFLHNSPYHGNSHAADHTILVPVIDDGGVHRYTVLTKAHQALAPGGALIVYERLIDDARRSNTPGLISSLNMLVMTASGFDFSGADCALWMQAAGFRQIRTEPLVDGHSMVVGFK